MMHIDLLEGSCEQWVIRLRAGHLAGTPVARADGITLYAPPGNRTCWPVCSSTTGAI